MAIPWRCGDTQTISAVTYLVWTYCTQRGDRDKKFLGISTRTLGTWWWAHLPWTLHSKETWWNFYSLIYDFNNLIFIAAKVFVNEHHSPQTNQFKSEYFTCHQLKISSLNFTTWRSKTTWLRHYMLLKLVLLFLFQRKVPGPMFLLGVSVWGSLEDLCPGGFCPGVSVQGVSVHPYGGRVGGNHPTGMLFCFFYEISKGTRYLKTLIPNWKPPVLLD